MSFRKSIVVTCVIAVVYLLLAEVGHALTLAPANFASFWPASGFLLAVLMRIDSRQTSAVMLGSLLGNVFSDLFVHDKSLPVSLCFWLGNCGEALAGVYLLRRLSVPGTVLDSFRKVAALVATAAVCPVLGATVGSLTVTIAYPESSFVMSWRTWYVADLLGIVIVGAPMLCWGAPGRICLLTQKRRLVELGVLVGLLIVVTSWAFRQDSISDSFALQLPYLVFPFLIWAALRFDVRIAASVGLVMTTLAVYDTVNDFGPFAGAAHSAQERVLLLQAFLALASCITLFLAASVEDRQQAQEGRERVIAELRLALGEIKALQGLLPICCACKKIRCDDGFWHEVESYFRKHADVDFSHGICPDCGPRLYGDIWMQAMNALEKS